MIELPFKVTIVGLGENFTAWEGAFSWALEYSGRARAFPEQGGVRAKSARAASGNRTRNLPAEAARLGDSSERKTEGCAGTTAFSHLPRFVRPRRGSWACTKPRKQRSMCLVIQGRQRSSTDGSRVSFRIERTRSVVCPCAQPSLLLILWFSRRSPLYLY